MEDLSLDDLLSGLQAAQEKKSMVRLSERNVVELVVKLKQLGFFGDDLLHTSNGREYITRDQLKSEVVAAVDAAGGRLPLVDLPSTLGVDLAHCERAAEEVITAAKGSTIQAQGEIITTRYFDALADEVDAELQGSGVVAVGDIARRTGLGVEMLTNVLKERIGKAVHGRLEGGVVYTDAYLARLKAQLRGALRGALAPVTLAAVRKDLGIENLGALGAVVPTLAEELVKEGAVSGRLAAGGSFVPSSFARSQQDFVRSFYTQNGYVTYEMAAKYGVANAATLLTEAFPDGVALSGALASPAVVHQVEAAVEEAVHNNSWCDALTAVPSDLSAGDAAALLGKCAAAGVTVLSETCAVSAAFLDGLKSILGEEAKKAAQEAHAAKKKGGAAAKAAAAAPAPTGGKKGSKSAPAMVVDDSDDDDDWDMGGKGKKGGKKGAKKGGGGGGGGGGGKKAAAPAPAKQKGKAASTSDVPSAAASTLSMESLEKRIIELHPDTEGAGADGDLPAALAAEVRPAVVAEYERALSDIFTAGAERRRRLRDAASARLNTAFSQLQLFARGAELFAGDDSTALVLHRHLMQTAAPGCVDALLHFLAADVAEEGDAAEGAPAPEEVVSNALPPSERTAIVRGSPADAQSALAAAVEALSAAATPTAAADFVGTLEAAAEAAGLRLKRLDKKSEAPLVSAQIETLKAQAEAASDAPTLLAAAVPLLVAKHRGRCVSVPGRALGPAGALLKEDLGEEGAEKLAAFHAAVVESLKGGGEETAAKLAELEPSIRAMLDA